MIRARDDYLTQAEKEMSLQVETMADGANEERRETSVQPWCLFPF